MLEKQQLGIKKKLNSGEREEIRDRKIEGSNLFFSRSGPVYFRFRASRSSPIFSFPQVTGISARDFNSTSPYPVLRDVSILSLTAS